MMALVAQPSRTRRLVSGRVADDVLDLEDGPASLIAIIESSGGRWSNPPSRLTAALASKGEVRAPTLDAGPRLIGFAVVSQWCLVVR